MRVLRVLILGAVTATWIAATDGTNFEPDALQAVVVVSYLIGSGGMVAVGGWLSLPAFALLFLGAQLTLRGENGLGNFVIEAPVVLLGITAAAIGRSCWLALRAPRPPLCGGAGQT